MHTIRLSCSCAMGYFDTWFALQHHCQKCVAIGIGNVVRMKLAKSLVIHSDMSAIALIAQARSSGFNGLKNFVAFFAPRQWAYAISFRELI